MKQSSTNFLRFVIFFIGAGVLALCVFIASRLGDAGAYRLVLIWIMVPAIPFFIALGQALRLLRAIDANNAFSSVSVNALKKIKFCAIAISSLYAFGMPLIISAADMDDAPGAVAMGLVVIFASFVIAVFAAVLQRLLQNAMEIKSENDLTV